MTTLVPIDRIRVGSRYRKDLGDINELAQNIQEIGLLHPVTVDKDYRLICGYRRIAACKKLGMKEIPAYTLSLEDIRHGELSENTIRKNFTFSEMVEIKKSLVLIERKTALERQKQGQRRGGNTHSSDRNDQGGNFPPSCQIQAKGKTRDKVAKYFDVSYKTMNNIESVYDAAKLDPHKYGDLIRKLDEGRLKPHKAFRELSNRRLKEKLFNQIPENIENENIQLLEGDFRDVSKNLKDSSIDLIFTDPPYNEGFVSLYRDLAELAGRVLKSNGSIVTYVPNAFIPTITSYMTEAGLKYWWTMAVQLKGSYARHYQRQIAIKWKPLLWFVKGQELITQDFISDLIISDRPEKVLHKWEQSRIEAEHVFKILTVENQKILDPFVGAGTSAIAAISLNRRFVGIDIDPEALVLVKVKIQNSLKSLSKNRSSEPNKHLSKAGSEREQNER